MQSLQKKIEWIGYFFEYFDENYPYLKLKDINRTIIGNFEEYLRQNDTPDMQRAIYNGVRDFFETMSEFPEFPPVPTKRHNPFPLILRPNDEKYIPPDIVEKFDYVMKHEDQFDIPLELRLAYWLLRTFPSRGTEILSLRLDCLKTTYSYYFLFIPTFKQNGGYDREELKAIPVQYVGHGKYIIDLIKRVQEQTKSRLMSYELKNEKDAKYLLLTTGFEFKKDPEKKIRTNRTKQHSKLITFHNQKINTSLKSIATILNITDKDGNIYAPTTHQFRHNGVTERRQFGYTVEQTASVSGHKSFAMMMRYTHPQMEAHQKILTELLPEPQKAPVEFESVIFNLDDETIEMLNMDKPKYLTWEVNGIKGVGICSNISGCRPNGATSVHFECYACSWFCPRAEYYEDYKKELQHWEEIIEETQNNPKRASTFENAIRNASYIRRIVQICENGIERHKQEVIKKIQRGELK